MPNIIEIRDKIKTLLEAIQVSGGTTQEIYIVYKYPETNPTGYPYAWIDYKGDESVVLTNTQDQVEYQFDIHLIQEKMEDFKGREDAEETALDRAFKVNDALRDDNNLSLAGIMRTRPIRTVKGYVDGGTRAELIFTLTVITTEDVTF